MLGFLRLAPVASRVSPRRASYFFFASPKKSNQKKGEPRPCRFAVPCATRSVRDTCKLASLELSTPLNRLRRFPLQGTTPAAGQSRFRGAPGRGCAALASPRLLVRCAHLAGLGFLISHASLLSRARHAVPLRLIPSFLTAHHGQPQGLPLRPSFLRPQSSPLTPHSSLLTPQSSPLTPTTSILTPQKIHQRLQQGLRRFCHLVVSAG